MRALPRRLLKTVLSLPYSSKGSRAKASTPSKTASTVPASRAVRIFSRATGKAPSVAPGVEGSDRGWAPSRARFQGQGLQDLFQGAAREAVEQRPAILALLDGQGVLSVVVGRTARRPAAAGPDSFEPGEDALNGIGSHSFPFSPSAHRGIMSAKVDHDSPSDARSVARCRAFFFEATVERFHRPIFSLASP